MRLNIFILVLICIVCLVASSSLATTLVDPQNDHVAFLGIDINEVTAESDGIDLFVEVTFWDDIKAPSAGDWTLEPDCVSGTIEVDTNQDGGTDFYIDLMAEGLNPGNVGLLDSGFNPLGNFPIVFTNNSFSISIPLADLGNDDGIADINVIIDKCDWWTSDTAGPVTSSLVLAPIAGIPTISEWGMIILTLCMLIGATIVIRRRSAATLKA